MTPQNKNDCDEVKPIFKIIKTNKETHLFDSGTGYVYHLEPLEYELLNILWEHNLSFKNLNMKELNDLTDLGYNKDNISATFNTIVKMMKDEQFLAAKQIKFNFHQSKETIIEMIEAKLESFVLVVTDNCNFRCDYCCFGDEYPNNRNHSNKRMTISTANQAIQFIMDHSKQSDKIYISFFGGEPLLEYSIIEHVIDTLHSKLPEKALTFGMATNGSLLNEKNIEFLVKHQIQINVSVDGPPSIHDRYRKKHDGSPTQELVMKGLRMLSKMHPTYFAEKVVLNVILVEPFDELHKTIEFVNTDNLLAPLEKNYSLVSDLDPTTFFDRFYKRSEQENHLESAIEKSKKKFISAAEKGTHCDCNLYYNFKSRRLKSINKYSNGLIRPHFIHEDVVEFHPHACCIPLKRKTLISVEGKLLLCEAEHTEYSLGNIWDGIDHERYFALLDDYLIFTNEHCNKCWAAPLCDECFMSYLARKPEYGWNDSKLDQHCAMLRRKTEDALKEFITYKEGCPAYERLFSEITI